MQAQLKVEQRVINIRRGGLESQKDNGTVSIKGKNSNARKEAEYDHQRQSSSLAEAEKQHTKRGQSLD